MSKQISRLAGFFLLIFFPALVAVSTEGPSAVVPQTKFDFGKSLKGAVIEHGFVLRNKGSAALRIEQARMTEPLLLMRMPAQIAPGAETLLRVTLDTSKVQGVYNGEVIISVNDPAMREIRLAFNGQVVPPIELLPRGAFFVTGRRGDEKHATIEIINHEPDPLRIELVEHSVERFTTKLETRDVGQRYRLTLTLNPEGPGGKKSETIFLRTSSRHVPLLKISANTYLKERVYAFPDAVDLGALQLADIEANPGLIEQAAQTLMVYQFGGTEFRATFRTDLPILGVKSERGTQGDRYQAVITLLPEKLEAGPITGSIIIETNDPEFSRITVPVAGFISGR
jgi:Protein of unknown function (DUF1573)